MLAQVTVTSLNDLAAADDGVMTLREAIAYVNSEPLLPASLGGLDAAHVTGEFGRIDPTQTDTIVFAPGLSGVANLTLGTELTINRPMTIEGDGRITVSAAGNDASLTTLGNGTRVFNVDAPGFADSVIFRRLAITGGDVAPAAVRKSWAIAGSRGLGLGLVGQSPFCRLLPAPC